MSEIWVLVSEFIRFKSIFPFKHEQIDLHSQISSHVSISFLFRLKQLYQRQTSPIHTRSNVLFSWINKKRLNLSEAGSPIQFWSSTEAWSSNWRLYSVVTRFATLHQIEFSFVNELNISSDWTDTGPRIVWPWTGEMSEKKGYDDH